MRRAQDQRGQALVVTVLFMTVLLAMAAAVLDVGAWYRTHRHLQATADASALAGAQALPDSPGEAIDLAVDYGARNGGGVPARNVAIKRGRQADDTIAVTAAKKAPGIFTRLFGIDSVDVSARAAARSSIPGKARYVAPITVSEKHPMLQCKPLPCFREDTQLTLEDRHSSGSGNAAGAFGLLNLIQGSSGNEGASNVADWMANGYDAYMPIGIYESVPSAEFNSSHFQEALRLRVGDEILLPVYRPPIKRSGSNAQYDIIGWVGFVITESIVSGNNSKLRGQFTRVTWEGIESDRSDGPDFGVRVIGLVE